MSEDQEKETANDFLIWGSDNAPYGPVPMPTLVAWVRDERVIAETWVFSSSDEAWMRAADIPELKTFFNRGLGSSMDGPAAEAVTPTTLRRVKVLADLNDAQLDQLAQYLELQKVPQWSMVIHKGDKGDDMFFILEGELRVRLVAGGAETSLATFGPGEFFGDISLFDHGPRSADVIANQDSTLLKMTPGSFLRLAKQAPALATLFLSATARTLTARIRADNARLGVVAEQFSKSKTGDQAGASPRL